MAWTVLFLVAMKYTPMQTEALQQVLCNTMKIAPPPPNGFDVAGVVFLGAAAVGCAVGDVVAAGGKL